MTPLWISAKSIPADLFCQPPRRPVLGLWFTPPSALEFTRLTDPHHAEPGAVAQME